MTFWTGVAWAVTGGSVTALLCFLAWMLVRGRRANLADSDSEWEFSLENYRPMERLLAVEDLAFLESQPGFSPQMGARWKRDRRRIFRMYLAELKRDFRRLHAEARLLVATGDQQSQAMVSKLLRQQWTFLVATTGIEIRLMLESLGIGKVDPRPLVQLLETMRADLAPGRMAPAL